MGNYEQILKKKVSVDSENHSTIIFFLLYFFQIYFSDKYYAYFIIQLHQHLKLQVQVFPGTCLTFD